ncbi:MAG: hypothetical protein ABIO80_05300 [Sphingomicrobium sp.]
MKPSLRFLMVAVVGWGGARAATTGLLPGAEMFRIERSEARPPVIAATEFPAIEPVAAADLAFSPNDPPQTMVAAPPEAGAATRYYAAAAIPAQPLPSPGHGAFARLMPTPAAQFYAPIPALDEWPLSRIAASSLPPLRQSTVVAPGQSIPAAFRASRLDRVQVAAWALLRSQRTGVAGTPSLASGGTLGASQAGSRLAYNFTRQIAATVRTSSEVGRRGGEIAAGVRIQPARAIPLWFTAERRQRLGSGGGGRNAFALFFESGVYNRPMPWRFAMDAYLQGGVVGRDGFVDGALTVTRPVMGRVSAGVGVWGGAQPGVARLDVGPRISLRVRDNVRVHLDWRQRVAGNAQPGSGAAVTLAGDF